jgi:hypothetical protein
VGLDRSGWHEKFLDALSRLGEGRRDLRCITVNLDRSDWLRQLDGVSMVLWKPHYMGHEFSGYFKEKVYFMERFLGLTVVPNFSTVWHFESKAAQSYLFDHVKAPTPKTVVSFDYDEASDLASRETYPVVRKLSAGAGSVNVRAVGSREDMRKDLEKTFCSTLWDRHLPGARRARRILSGLPLRWFREYARRRILKLGLPGMAYWQEFIRGNDADLRITVIGDRYATGFWRDNRPGDFRASGGGRLVYHRPLPEDAVRECLRISRRLDLDSMAYDILFRDGDMVICEMSYGYSDSAVHRVSGYQVLREDGSLTSVPGNTWPQELWVRWALHRLETRDCTI